MSGREAGSKWFLVNAKAGQERLAEANLARQGYETFLPLERRTVRHARRVQATVRAYFPGYLFARIDLTAQVWRPINSTLGVQRIVAGPDGPTAAPAGLVESLQSAADAGGVMQPREDWAPGARVEIVDGPFADQLGVVEGLGGADRVRVLLSMVGGGLRIVAPSAALRRSA